MIEWLKRWICGSAYSAAKQQGYEDGRLDGLHEARERAAKILSEAELSAELRASMLRQQAEDEAAEIERKAQSRGESRGYKKGRAAGVEVAREEAMASALRAAMIYYGIAIPDNAQPVQISEDEFSRLVDTRNQHRPNIYKFRDCWKVRIVVDGEMKDEVFPIVVPRVGRRNRTRDDATNEARKRAEATALIQAIRWRNSFAGDFEEYWTMWVECVQTVDSAVANESYNREQHMYQAAMEFYARRSQRVTDLNSEVPGWFGEDPEDRLEIEDTQILNMPWTVLFTRNAAETVPARLCQTFGRLGLGSSHQPRTVRDLLMITGPELLAVNNFGPASLRNLREGLREHGLALWGDDVPPPPSEPRRPGEREFRAIDLGD